MVKQVATVGGVAGSSCNYTEEEFPSVVAHLVDTAGSSLVL